MRKIFLLSLAISLWCANSIHAQHAFIGQALLDQLATADKNELIPIFLSLEDRVDITALKAELNTNQTPVNKRSQIVMHRLKTKANETQPQIVASLQKSGLGYDNVQRFWITNVIALDATPALVNFLAQNEAIAQIVSNPAIFSLQEPTRGTGDLAKSIGGTEPGLEIIGAREMWEMGYTGHGTIAFPFDTGIMPDHPSHSDRFLGNLLPLESTWFGYDSEVPTDRPGNHGTHVTGTILGLDPETADTIGVAPGAYFISSDVVHSNNDLVRPLADFMLGYEWALNPDGDENTSDDIPTVINNSWGQQALGELFVGWFECDDFIASVQDAVLAAGIANVYSAGNLGPVDESIGVPHNISTGLVNTFTVAAVSSGAGYPVASFSSRGPSRCDDLEGSLLIKPEVSAPGVNVRSSVGHDEYAYYSGTSMSAPHTSGAILLLKEAFPYLTGEELELALYYSAIDLGEEGEDNTYGMGLINVYAAYLYLSENNTPVPPQVLENDIALISIDEPSFYFGCNVGGQGEITPVVTIKNTGLSTIDTYSLSSSINGGTPSIFGVDQAIAPGEEVQLTLASISYSAQGLVEFHVKIDEIADEYDVWNNHKTIRWQQLNEFDLGSNGAFNEDFTTGLDPDVWIIQNPDESVTWDISEVLQIDGTTGNAAWMNHPGYGVIESQKDRLVSPLMTGNTDQQVLTFDYFYRKRSSTSYTQDTLTIYINNDCSPVDIEIWQAGGSELWTNDQNQTDAFPETTEDWSTISINLPTEMADQFYVLFETRNRRGNNLLIDNVNISGSNSVADKQVDLDFEIYPNPATDLVLIKPNASLKANEVKVIDLSGRVVAEDGMNRVSYTFDISDLAPGAYLVYITYSNGQQHAEKLIVE